jgi:ubiquinone/menaquinone biosynthesis C-methylase UbiE
MKPAIYDLINAPGERGSLGRLRRRVLAGVTGRVLEVGVGTGLTLRYYDKSVQLTALDPDHGMLARARQRAAKLGLDVTFVEASAQELVFPDTSFDFAVGNLVLCTIPDPRKALKELRRVVKPGGQLRLLEHVRGPGPVIGIAQDLITPVWKRLADGCHLNRNTLQAVQETGWQVQEARGHFMGLKFLEIIAVNLSGV